MAIRDIQAGTLDEMIENAIHFLTDHEDGTLLWADDPNKYPATFGLVAYAVVDGEEVGISVTAPVHSFRLAGPELEKAFKSLDGRRALLSTITKIARERRQAGLREPRSVWERILEES